PDAADRPEIEARIRRLAPAAPAGASAAPRPEDAEEAPGELGGGGAIEPGGPRPLPAPPHWRSPQPAAGQPPAPAQRADAADGPRRRPGDEEPPPRSALSIAGW